LTRARDFGREQEERIRPAVEAIRAAVVATEIAYRFGRLRAAVILERRRELLLERLLRGTLEELPKLNRALSLLERARDFIAGDLFETLPDPICIDSDSDPESAHPGEPAADSFRRIRRRLGRGPDPLSEEEQEERLEEWEEQEE